VKTTQRYAHLAHDTLIDACNSVVNSLGEAFGPVVPVAQQAVPVLQVA
jgi:hypothetical protein